MSGVDFGRNIATSRSKGIGAGDLQVESELAERFVFDVQQSLLCLFVLSAEADLLFGDRIFAVER